MHSHLERVYAIADPCPAPFLPAAPAWLCSAFVETLLDPERDSALAATLVVVADALAAAKDRWWIIGSAAMALHGARPIVVGDVDLLVSARDATMLFDRWGIAARDHEKSGIFRSAIFMRFEDVPLVVEIMAGLKVRTPHGWTVVAPKTREVKPVGGASIHVPSVDELIAMCVLFGREKDFERAELLARVAATDRLSR